MIRATQRPPNASIWAAPRPRAARTARPDARHLAPRRLAGCAIALGLVAGGCEAPQAPTWNVDLTIPITSRTRTLEEMIAGQDNLGIDSLGTVTLMVEKPIDRVAIEDQVQIDSFSDTATYELGPLEIDTPAPSSKTFRFDEVWPPATLFDGQYHQVPAFPFDVAGQLPPLGSFSQATFETAICEIELRNQLPIALDSAQLIFRNAVSATVATTAEFNQPVPPGGRDVVTLDLAGVALESQLDVQVLGQAAGSVDPVLIQSSDSFTIEVRFLPPVRVQSALTIVSEQTIVRSQAVALGGGARAGTVEFASGYLEVAVENATALQSEVRVMLPEVLAATGDTLSGQTVVGPGANGGLGFDLAGATYEPRQPGEVQVQVTLVAGSGGVEVLVAATDQVRAAVALQQPATVARFTGVLDPTTVALTPAQSALDLPSGLDQISFAAAELELAIDNTAGFPIDLDLELVGTRDARRPVIVPVRGRLAAASGGGGVPAHTRIVLDRHNSNIVELMNLVPSAIELRGTALIGDGVTSGSVVQGDYLEGGVTLNAPMIVELQADRIDTDPEELTIDADTRQTIHDDVSHGVVIADLNNHLPVGATAHLVVSRTPAGARDPAASGNLVLSGEMAAPAIDANGLVTEAAGSRLEFTLDKDDLRIFEESPIYTGVVLDLAGSGGRTIRLLASDWVEVQAVAIMRMRADFR